IAVDFGDYSFSLVRRRVDTGWCRPQISAIFRKTNRRTNERKKTWPASEKELILSGDNEAYRDKNRFRLARKCITVISRRTRLQIAYKSARVCECAGADWDRRLAASEAV